VKGYKMTEEMNIDDEINELDEVDSRVKKINTISAQKMEEFLTMLEDNEIDVDEMLGIAYASMVVVNTMGFSSMNMAEDATIAAEKLIGLLVDEE
jgi:hypothetical protein